MSLSVCILTNDPGARVTALLRPLREVADEIVVAVDSRVDPDRLGTYAELADRLLRFEWVSPMERLLPWLHAQCSGDWILRLDGDEVPSSELVAQLPDVVADRAVLQCLVPRRWLFGGPRTWLDEVPWYPDYQLRLVRNDPATLWFPRILHSSAARVAPARLLEAPIYHLDCLLRTADERAAKAQEYETMSPDLRASGGYRVNDFYLPEHFHERPLADVPAEDVGLIEAVLSAADPDVPPAAPADVPVVTQDEIEQGRPDPLDPTRELAAGFYAAAIEPVESDDRMRAGEVRLIHVRVTNQGDAEWPGGLADRPSVLLGYRWRTDLHTAETYATGRRVRLPRTLGPGAAAVVQIEVAAPTEPGDWVLEFDLLHEYVRWFHVNGRMLMRVRPATYAPLLSPAELPPVETVVAPERVAVAAVFAPRDAALFLPTVLALRRVHPGLRVLVGAPDPTTLAPLTDAGATPVTASTLAGFVDAVWREYRCHVFAVDQPVLVSPGFLGPALVALDDPRVASVSFLANAAGFLSFPHRNNPVSHQVESLDESSIALRLRSTPPAGAPVPIAVPGGCAVLLSRHAMSAVGPLEETPTGRVELAVADWSLRARRRGFQDLLDPTTYYSRPYDLDMAATSTWLDVAERRWLFARHPFAAAHYDDERDSLRSPMAAAMNAARAKVLGLRVLIDGSCLGAKQMGTQVHTLSLVQALADRPDVVSVAVALATDVPDYARATLSHPKVRAAFCPAGDVTPLGPVDVVHRPYQPDGPLDLHSWRKTGHRTVITIQDLIAYQVGSYQPTDARWLEYRAHLRDVAREVDGVVCFSHDVRRQLELEQVPVDPSRTYVIEMGTDHLTGDEPGRIPRDLARRGFVAGRFALVLGATYAHKNRDLAMQAHRTLRARGHRLSLVLVGAAVPHGSSRLHESQSGAYDDDVYVIPDVDSAERNWLLRHAELVLYPTSAEGFGLVPYEAARFGTPSVLVPFGPLRETSGELPVEAADWSPEALADAAERLLTDPGLVPKQLSAALDAGSRYTWAGTAERMTVMYRTLLARPAR